MEEQEKRNEWRTADISDRVWELIAPHLPGQRGQWGGIACDNIVK